MNAFPTDWPLLNDVTERLGWILVHSVWQFAVIGFVAALLMGVFRSASSRVRYGLLLSLFCLASLAPITTWLVLPRPEVVASQPVEMAATAGPVPTNDAPVASKVSLPSTTETETAASPSLMPDIDLKNSPPRSEFTTFEEQVRQTIDPYLPTLVIAWFLGVVACSLRPLIGWRMVNRLRTVGTSKPSQEIVALFRRISTRLRIKSSVEILESTVATTPMMVGYLRPVVLVPVSFVTNVPLSQLEAILAHELAHVRRHDFAVNLVQTLVETLFFYHPAIWWLSHRIRIEREHCCDDLVVRTLDNRGEYGRALIAVERLRSEAPSIAIGANDGSLLARMRRIAKVADPSDQQVASRLPAAMLALVGLSLSVVVMLSLQANADEKEDNEPSAFIAELPDDIEVELVAVGYHPSAGKTWWKPNGDPLSQPPDLPDSGFSIGVNAEEKSRSRELLLKIRGLPQNHRVRTEYKPPSASGSSYLNGLWIGYHGAGPFDAATTSIRVGITTAPYGPWMSFDTDGLKSDKIEVPARLQSIYEKVIVKEIESDGDGSTTTLFVDNDSYNGLYDVADFELYAVDEAGKQYRRSSESVPAFGDLRGLTFNLPITDIVRFEYRLRPYTKWVTFDNVSLRPGQQSGVRISTETTGDQEGSPDATPSLGEFGPESHGLQCRLVALPADVNDDDPSFEQTDSEFARPAEVTLGVELKNVTNEPIVLAGVRNGEGYAEEVQGNPRTEMLAPCWFDLDFTSLDGNSISRPHRELYEGWILAHGASTHELSPGQSLRIVLRPANFLKPFDHELPPGHYAVKVQYQGPDETLRERVREHWPDKPILNAWKHQVESAPIEFSIAGSEGASAETNLVWGPVKDGLQAAIDYTHFDDDASNPSQAPGVPVGTSVGVNFHVRNVSDEVITFVSETGRQGDTTLVTDAQANKIEVRETFMSGWPIDVEWRLQTGEVAELSVLAPAINSIKQPGRYDVRYTIRFNSRVQRDDEGNVIFPRPGDYDSELETGVTPLYLRDASDVPNRKTKSRAVSTDDDGVEQATKNGPAFLLPDHRVVAVLGFTPDSTSLVSVSWDKAPDRDATQFMIRSWDMATRTLSREVELQWQQDWNRSAASMKLSGDCTKLVSSLGSQLGIWDVATGKLLKRLDPPEELKPDAILQCISCTPDFTRIASGRNSRSLGPVMSDAHAIVWDVSNEQVLRTITLKNAIYLQSLDLSTDGRRLATTGAGRIAEIWDVSSGNQLLNFTNRNQAGQHPDPEVKQISTELVASVGLSPDGKLLAVGDMLGIKLLDSVSGKVRQLIDAPYRYHSGHPEFVFSPNGEFFTLIGTGTDKARVVPIWSTTTGDELVTLEVDANAASFSGDGKRVAVGRSDVRQAIAIWGMTE